MSVFDFTIIASGLNPEAPDFADRFFEAGCDDGTIAFQKGVIILEFAREARSFGHALMSAVRDVRKAGATVERVEPDYLVSLSDIARLTSLTRSAVSNYAKGERGTGFPPPAARVTSDTPLWDWVEVSRWMHRQGRLGRDDVVRARIVRETNVLVSDHEAGHGFVVQGLSRELRPEAA